MSRRGSSRGFTLIEVLATLMLLALVMPTVMKGIAISSVVADATRHRTEAGGLAQTELEQILVTQSWQNGNQSGDFSPDNPGYTWETQVGPWSGDTEGAGLQEIELTVKWDERGHNKSLTLSSLAYLRSTTSGATGTTGTTTQ